MARPRVFFNDARIQAQLAETSNQHATVFQFEFTQRIRPHLTFGANHRDSCLLDLVPNLADAGKRLRCLSNQLQMMRIGKRKILV